MRNCFLLCFLIALLCLPTFSYATPTALDIIKKADEVRGATDWGFYTDVIDYQRKGKKNKVLGRNQYRITATTINGVYKAVAFFLAPKNVKGQKSLKNGQVYWQYFPDTKNIVRISGAQRMAGQVTAADLASSNFENDYNGKLLGEEKTMGKNCYKLELLQKNDQVAYYKLIYWVEKGSYNPVKVMYYAISGKLLKTAYYRDFKLALGRKKPHELFIIDPLKPGHITRMLYKNIRSEKMPEYTFRKDSLKTVRAPQDKAVEAGPTLSATEILKNADDVRGASDWGFYTSVIDYQRKGKKNKVLTNNKYRITATTINGVYKAVAFFLAPKNVKGQKSLKNGQIYWQYFPGTKNLVRISGAQRMSGQVTAADLASSNFSNDYNAKLMGEEVVLGKKCYKLELLQKNNQVAYYKLQYWIEKGTFNPIKVMYYAVSGKLLKTAYYRSFKKALGRIKPHELFIVDPLKPGHVTRMIYSMIREEKMPEYAFRKDSLKTVKAPKD